MSINKWSFGSCEVSDYFMDWIRRCSHIHWFGIIILLFPRFFFSLYHSAACVSDNRPNIPNVCITWGACRLNGLVITCWMSAHSAFLTSVLRQIQSQIKNTNEYMRRVAARSIASLCAAALQLSWLAASEVVVDCFIFFSGRIGMRSTEIRDSTALLWIAREKKNPMNASPFHHWLRLAIWDSKFVIWPMK